MNGRDESISRSFWKTSVDRKYWYPTSPKVSNISHVRIANFVTKSILRRAFASQASTFKIHLERR